MTKIETLQAELGRAIDKAAQTRADRTTYMRNTDVVSQATYANYEEKVIRAEAELRAVMSALVMTVAARKVNAAQRRTISGRS